MVCMASTYFFHFKKRENIYTWIFELNGIDICSHISLFLFINWVARTQSESQLNDSEW